MKIPTNKTFLAGSEISYLAQVITGGDIGSDGRFTRACAELLEERYSIRKLRRSGWLGRHGKLNVRHE